MKKGFTLIEFLVVLVIVFISIIVLILMGAQNVPEKDHNSALAGKITTVINGYDYECEPSGKN